VRNGSYVSDYRGNGGVSGDPDVTVIEMSDGKLTLTLHAVDDSGEVQVSILGPRAGVLGTFPVHRASIGDLAEALRKHGLTRESRTS
jgi:hypothetical protein